MRKKNRELLQFLLLAKTVGEARGLDFQSPEIIDAYWGRGISQALQDTVPEKVFLPMARTHKVITPLYRAYKFKRVPFSPADAKKLSTLYLLQQSMKIRLTGEWENIQKQCKAKGIPAAVLKGPALSALLYESSLSEDSISITEGALERDYTDLDLLINPEDLNQFRMVLADAGYVEDNTGINNNLQIAPWLEQLMVKPHHLIFRSPKSPYRLEIHCQRACSSLALELTSDYQSESFLRAKNRDRDVFGYTENFQDQDIDMLIDVLIHGAKHGWMLLHWLLDGARILFLLSREAINSETAEKFMQLIREKGSEKELFFLVELVGSLYAVGIADCLKELQKEQVSASLVKRAQNILSSGGRKIQKGSLITLITHRVFYLNKLSTAHTRSLLEFFIPAYQDMQRLSLPSRWQWIYFPLRPLFVVERRLLRYMKKVKKLK